TSLWARHSFEATVVDGKGKSHFVNGDGVLLYRRPGHMLVVGNKDIAGKIFEIGTTPERYWLTLIPESDTMWWGKYEHVDKLGADAPIPIRPDLVMEVLGIEPIDTNLRVL